MANAIRVDVRRLLLTKSFLFLGLLIAVIMPAAQELIMYGAMKAMKQNTPVTMNDFTGYAAMASIYLAVFVTAYLYAEVGEGIIRNKIISGTKRRHIFFSYCLVNSCVAVLLQIVSVVSTALVPLMLHMEFACSPEEIVRLAAVTALAGAAVSVLYTVIFICFCTSKISIALPASIAIFTKILTIVILDALYTDSGIPKVTGSTLKVYEAIDRYVSFSYLQGPVRWDSASYLIGNGALIVLSVLAGLVVFSKKSLK